MNNIEDYRKSITVNGLCGFRNIGNTCYINSALQCLIATEPLTNYFLNKEFLKILLDKIKDKENIINNSIDDQNLKNYLHNSFAYQYFRLIHVVWNNNREIIPSSLKYLIGKKNDNFMGREQGDSQEFLNCLLDQIHEELKIKIVKDPNNDKFNDLKYKINQYEEIINNNEKNIVELERVKDEYKKFMIDNSLNILIMNFNDKIKEYIENNYSIITELFTGVFMDVIICNKCNNLNNKFEPYTILQVPIPDNGNIKLYDCLEEYTKSEYLFGDNKYKCEKCSDYVEATKKTYIWNTPNILIIQLKRFKNHEKTYQLYKVASIIDFPINNLNFNDYNFKHYKNNAKYELYGVIQHTGNLNSGHYIAYTKNLINKKWYEYNDNNVVHIPDDKIENCIKNQNTYILFYNKSN